MCFEYEPDRRVRDDSSRRKKRSRRLFERYRALSRQQAATQVAAGPQPPDVDKEREPALASH